MYNIMYLLCPFEHYFNCRQHTHTHTHTHTHSHSLTHTHSHTHTHTHTHTKVWTGPFSPSGPDHPWPIASRFATLTSLVDPERVGLKAYDGCGPVLEPRMVLLWGKSTRQHISPESWLLEFEGPSQSILKWTQVSWVSKYNGKPSQQRTHYNAAMLKISSMWTISLIINHTNLMYSYVTAMTMFSMFSMFLYCRPDCCHRCHHLCSFLFIYVHLL